MNEDEDRQRGPRKKKMSPPATNASASTRTKLNDDQLSDIGALIQERVVAELQEPPWEPVKPLDVPVEMPLPEKVLTERWRINRILWFQGIVILLCLAAVVVSPVAATQIAAVSICLGTLAFSRYALQRAYRK